MDEKTIRPLKIEPKFKNLIRPLQRKEYLQLEQNMIQFVGPVVDVEPDEKPLGIALREINDGMISVEAEQKA